MIRCIYNSLNGACTCACNCLLARIWYISKIPYLWVFPSLLTSKVLTLQVRFGNLISDNSKRSERTLKALPNLFTNNIPLGGTETKIESFRTFKTSEGAC